MAMDINGVYVNYAGAYTNQKTTNRTSNSKVVNESGNSTGQISSVENENSSNNIRKTAADELKYLSKKYGGYTFAAANFQPGMRYGSNKTTNVAISPDFLQKMANDPELEEEYEKEIANMQALDAQRRQRIESGGGTVVAMGWAIDKDGGISCWSIGKYDDSRSKVTSPNEYGAKIRQQKAEKKKTEEKVAERKKEKAEQKEALEEKLKVAREEKAALKEKIDSDNKRVLGDKYKGSDMYDITKDILFGEARKGLKNDMVGFNFDKKL
ncbi:hypothetical protein SAMN05216349_11766 [Oribacterium sp. KHPX15]|uniref:DUF6033 family protein n=1 Tax=Oribacterium sp. KHPX15 TaxID=1855342 RepID=UPI00089576E8|nr:DUF6033 family protein [Oribacterium sp. KHPX15]SEA57671.1 hypothetical protein SAMN05216349_11766 [Oribacterium sp. KHPX15]